MPVTRFATPPPCDRSSLSCVLHSDPLGSLADPHLRKTYTLTFSYPLGPRVLVSNLSRLHDSRYVHALRSPATTHNILYLFSVVDTLF